MKNKINTESLVVSALLCAIGIIIPMVSPFRLVIEPASYTLASHVALIIAMFISPSTTAFVAFGTTLGFLLGGFPIVVVARAFSQVVFALIGAFYLQKHPETLNRTLKVIVFAFLISIVHGVGEIIAVLPFYIGGGTVNLNNYFYLIFVLVGFGTVIHSMVDFFLALWIWKLLPYGKKKHPIE